MARVEVELTSLEAFRSLGLQVVPDRQACWGVYSHLTAAEATGPRLLRNIVQDYMDNNHIDKTLRRVNCS
jgi:hypothetical protein